MAETSKDPDLDPAHNRALAAIEAAGIPFTASKHEPSGSLEEAARARGVTPGEIVKSMVVRLGEGRYAIALVPGDRKISWPKLRHAMGVNRASMPPAEEAFGVTGYERGTITPFGANGDLPVLTDVTVPDGPISMGGGAHRVAVYLLGSDLKGRFDAQVLDITEPVT